MGSLGTEMWRQAADSWYQRDGAAAESVDHAPAPGGRAAAQYGSVADGVALADDGVGAGAAGLAWLPCGAPPGPPGFWPR